MAHRRRRPRSRAHHPNSPSSRVGDDGAQEPGDVACRRPHGSLANLRIWPRICRALARTHACRTLARGLESACARSASRSTRQRRGIPRAIAKITRNIYCNAESGTGNDAFKFHPRMWWETRSGAETEGGASANTRSNLLSSGKGAINRGDCEEARSCLNDHCQSLGRNKVERENLRITRSITP